jgi:peptidoglycan/xylan/chitin deacetylase (PgdA/CDA1 family)
MRRLKDFLLYVLRAIGGFAIARQLTRSRLRILCYHGFSIGDEHQFSPLMFMRAETFERRMQILRRRRIPVIRLDTAIKMFQAREIQNCETVITLDDGWSSSLTIGLPVLQKYGFPASIYISTQHLAHRSEVFNVILSYMIHRSSSSALTLENVHPELDGIYGLKQDRQQTVRTLIAAAERAGDFSHRLGLLEPIAAALAMNLDDVLKDDRFRLLEGTEVQEAFRQGMDIQLHTHSHKLPDASFEAMAEEINKNRDAIRAIVGTEPRHFCYPSGIYNHRQPEWLARLNIASGTTCDPGLNGPRDSVMLLKRYLDGENSSDIAFEAEICGVRDLARTLRACLGGRSHQ